jgi:hypothetical protein
MKIDTAQQSFDMQSIRNRRFMFNPDTGTLLLGFQCTGNVLANGKILDASHAQEHGESGTQEPYDDFIRGWVGSGGKYRNGIIHFAPPIDRRYIELFERSFDTLLMFRQNGVNDKTIIRGFGDVWEQPLSQVFETALEVDAPAQSENQDDLET